MEKAKGYQKAESLAAAQHCSSSLQHQTTTNLSKSKPCWSKQLQSSYNWTTSPQWRMRSSEQYYHPKIARAALEYYEPPLLFNVSRVMWSTSDDECGWQRKGWDGGAAKCQVRCWALCTALGFFVLHLGKSCPRFTRTCMWNLSTKCWKKLGESSFANVTHNFIEQLLVIRTAHAKRQHWL